MAGKDSGFSLIHVFKEPIEYHIDHMETCIGNNKSNAKASPGFIGIVLEHNGHTCLIDPADDYNLSRYMTMEGMKIVGRGVLVEHVTSDEWIVAWRAYGMSLEVIPWER